MCSELYALHGNFVSDLVGKLAPRTLTVFLLHGVTDKPCHRVLNYTGKHVDTQFFEDFLQGVCAVGRTVSMDEVVEIREKNLPYPDYSFVLTFDDGFANNYEVAAPLLRKYGVNAAFYITTGWTGVNGLSWIDKIELCFEHCASGAVRLPWLGELTHFDSPRERIAILQEVRKHAKNSPALDLDAFVNDVFAQCGMSPVDTSDDPLHRKMSWQQIAELDADPLFSVGGHTHTHAVMSYLEAGPLQNEIDRSLTLLSEKAGVGPDHYSYPEGQKHCYNERVIRALRKSGVVCCPTAIEGTNNGSESLFDLKRVLVG
jgi:peptidoglycan/xylan/chitin deacetylase (PgdA/CDA1 family)